MPQTDFFLDAHDLHDLANALFQIGCILVPDLNYPSAAPLEIRDSSTLSRVLEIEHPRLFFVVSQIWLKYPLAMGSVEKNGVKSFFVSQKNGGPSIDVFIPHSFQDDLGAQILPPGFIGYHERFWNPYTNQMEAAPPPLVEVYKRITKMLRADSKTVKLKRRTYAVTKHVFDSGVKLSIFTGADSTN
jgi:hypothetical protein